MNLLLIDIGNTQTVLGFGPGEKMKTWRLSTVSSRTADEYRHQLQSMLGDDLASVDGVALSSVVPAVTTEFVEAVEGLITGEPVVVGPGVKTGMSVRVDNPREVGADRIVNAVAAIERFGSPVITVDFGTAITVDLIGAGDEYLGGSIAPGIAVGAEALVDHTAALRRVDLVAPDRAVGRSTTEALQSGLIYGYAGLVDALIDRFRVESGSGAVPVVATGGAAATVVAHCRNEIVLDSSLTLRGLRLIWEKNHS